MNRMTINSQINTKFSFAAYCLHYRFVCFAGKPFVKIVFHIFQYLIAPKKKGGGQWKTIFGQRKTLIKIRLIFYRLVSKKLFWKTISLSCIVYPINIIFAYSRGKHNILVPSLSHGKLSHSFSLPLTFSLLTPSLSKFQYENQIHSQFFYL